MSYGNVTFAITILVCGPPGRGYLGPLRPGLSCGEPSCNRRLRLL